MAKDPAFLFYSTDFFMGTIEMSDEQVGEYIRLMCLQHQKGHLSEQIVLGTLHGNRDEAILSKFQTDESGLYFNVRLEEEIEKRKTYSESRRKNRSSAPKPSSPTYDNHMSNICESYDEHMVNENISKDIDTSIKNGDTKVTGVQGEKETAFDVFWEAYPKKVGKGAARRSFEKVKVKLPVLLDAIEQQRASPQWKRDNGQYIPNPATWLNQGRWEDEVPTGGFIYNDSCGEDESL